MGRHSHRTLPDRSRHPILVHCSAGKDRTGFLAAVTLALIGVTCAFVVPELGPDVVLALLLVPAVDGARPRLQFVHVEDLADGLVALCRAKAGGVPARAGSGWHGACSVTAPPGGAARGRGIRERRRIGCRLP